jgi:hypothetical protein
VATRSDPERHFLADSPKGMDQKHYVRFNDAEFFSALDWLRGQLLAM